MPRQSPTSVVLSEDERKHLELIAHQYTSPYCDVIRAKIVLLASQGLSNDVIASRLDTATPDRQQVAQALLSGPIAPCTAVSTKWRSTFLSFSAKF